EQPHGAIIADDSKTLSRSTRHAGYDDSSCAERRQQCCISRERRGICIEDTCIQNGNESPTLEGIAELMGYFLQVHNKDGDGSTNGELPQPCSGHEVCWRRVRLGVVDRPYK